ncbi:WD40-repeat-containing domain protein [Astrocystis sublimbata]|nr:WD40-repeat-containing domain protein [Astrocystis sublimbata]
MSSIPSRTAPGHDLACTNDPIAPPPPAPPSSHDSRSRAKAASAAATDPSISSRDGPVHQPRSTASQDGGTDISIPHRQDPHAPTSVKKERAKLARKDTASAGPKKENTKESTEPREAIKEDAREPRTAANGGANAPTPTPLIHRSSSVDPLSHHIFTRTNTEHTITSRLLNPSRPESPPNESASRPVSDVPNRLSTVQPESGSYKKKSLLSRLSMIGGKKKDDSSVDNESEISEHRTEGANAVAFSSALYIPHHKQPPRYIRVRNQNRKCKEFDRIFLAQELGGPRPKSSAEQYTSEHGVPPSGEPAKADSILEGPIWAVEFSQDGKYLATGGRDRVLRVWAVIATEEDRKAYDDQANADSEKEERLSAPVFQTQPAREFKGHEGDILDLSWSKNNFLLSSSMDKTVRLWHLSRRECLCTFKHKDFVASIAFHPRDDRFFLAGSLDSSLRLWSIPDKAVAFTTQLADIITAVGFSPDGKTAIAGTLHGLCMLYETEGLKSLSQLHVRSSRGKNAKGSKITGIQTIDYSPDNTGSDVKLLVSSNDSRIRIYNLATKQLEAKLKGHENACNQIRASFSDDGAFVICGSEDRKAFIWSRATLEADSKDKRAGEYFEAHSDVVTTAVFAPTTTRQLLQASQDPIFALCNPPPITLRSKEESTATSQVAYDAQSEYSELSKKPEELSPAYISRSEHRDGQIIVTTDNTGLIKVFRQDCAFHKRRYDSWDTQSTFSRKLGRDRLLLARTGSIVTGGTSVSSRDPHSRRGSLSQTVPVQINSERIDNWRHGVEGNPGRPSSMILASTNATTTPAGSVRSPSPTKAAARTPVSPMLGNNSHLHFQDAQNQLHHGNTNVTSPMLHPISPAVSNRSNKTGEAALQEKESVPPTPSFSLRTADNNHDSDSDDDNGDEDDLRLDSAGASYSFWNLAKWRNMSQGRSNGSANGVNPSSSPPKHERIPSGNSNGLVSINSHHRRSNRISVSKLWPSPVEERDDDEDDEECNNGDGVNNNNNNNINIDNSENENLNHNPGTSKPNTTKTKSSIKNSKNQNNSNSTNNSKKTCRKVDFLAPPPSTSPALSRNTTNASQLSSELTDSERSESFKSVRSGTDEDEGEGELRCVKCGNGDFRAKKVGERQRLLCGSCGRMVDV